MVCTKSELVPVIGFYFAGFKSMQTLSLSSYRWHNKDHGKYKYTMQVKL